MHVFVHKLWNNANKIVFLYKLHIYSQIHVYIYLKPFVRRAFVYKLGSMVANDSPLINERRVELDTVEENELLRLS